MKIDVAVKFIIVLLVIMIVSLGAALIIMNRGDDGEKETKPTVTTTASDTTKPDTTTTPNQTTTPEETTTPEVTTTPEQTTTPEVTTTPEETTAPDVTDPPEIPDGLLIEKSFKSDTGVSLNLRADVTAYEENGKVYLKVDLYLEHYSINVKSKNGVITVGDNEITFKTSAIKVDENKKTTTLLASEIFEVTYGETVNIKTDLAINMTYGKEPNKVELKTITAEGTVEIK